MRPEHQPMPERTPEQHRKEVERWRANAPADDSAIFRDRWDAEQRGGKPRHGSLAEQLAPLLAWMKRPEGLLPDDPQPEPADAVPMSSTWAVVADNNNIPPKDFRVERAREITPSVDEIMKQVETGDIERNRFGQIIRIGTLRFAGGNLDEYDTPWERGYKLSPEGKVFMTTQRVPVGGMLGQRERQARTVGGADDAAAIAASNRYFCEVFGASFRRKPGRRAKGKGRIFSKAETRAMLDEAYANTPVLPPITRYPPGMPSAGAAIADSFVGMKKSTCAGNGAQAWEDICTSLVNREVWAEAIAEMSESDVATMQKATTGKARAFTGLSGGRKGGNAFAQGKRALLAANDNLADILRRAA